METIIKLLNYIYYHRERYLYTVSMDGHNVPTILKRNKDGIVLEVMSFENIDLLIYNLMSIIRKNEF